MYVNITDKNPAVVSITQDPGQLIFLDANILIPPYRNDIKHGIQFDKYLDIFLDTLFSTYTNLAIHEAVRNEIVGSKAVAYISEKIDSCPCRLHVHKDSSLTKEEKWIRNTYEEAISMYTNILLYSITDRIVVKLKHYHIWQQKVSHTLHHMITIAM